MKKDDWILLSDDRVGVIVDWNTTTGEAGAETPSGAKVDRPEMRA